ncbi:MAG: hypothetical protein ACI4XF_05435 [Oscillospiraceae bacterium]
MDILEILKTSSSDLLPEDLELFKTELAVGGYSEEYQKECTELIKALENWQQEAKPTKTSDISEVVSAMQVDASQINPNGQSKSTVPFLEQFKADLNAMRLSEKYRSSFRTYIKQHPEFDESFVDANFSLFEEWEIEAILSELTFSEQFLEKYFSVLDKNKIARYQLFSEHFYQKHFSDFDAETVLKKGKNEWRKKENRSKQFAVFLRLKGVQY